ncbi:MAG TPA: hypothetical protein VGP64_09945 [Polyangia bacterium]
MDAMDEGSGGRGWEKLGPEERAKLLRDRQGQAEAAGRPGSHDGSHNGSHNGWSSTAERRPARVAGYFASASPSR